MIVERPSNLKKKEETETKFKVELAKKREESKKLGQELNKYYLQQGEKYHKEYLESEKSSIQNKRKCKDEGSLYVESEPKFLLVVRTKGINKLDPKTKKILILLRLRQINNAVFLKNNKAIKNMLIRVQPYIMWGFASRSTVHQLLYKRGYCKVEGQRLPLNNNRTIEKVLGKHNIKCIEDLKHEILTVGQHFKEANNFIWPFKLRNPAGGFDAKNHPYLEGGDHGDRDIYINSIVKLMI